MTTQQLSLLDVTLPVAPYSGRVPSAPKDTSVAAAEAFTPKHGTWQYRVLMAFYEYGPLTDEALERLLNDHHRSARPRRRELEKSGFIEDSGSRVKGSAEVYQVLWQLTPQGVVLAERLATDSAHGQAQA